MHKNPKYDLVGPVTKLTDGEFSIVRARLGIQPEILMNEKNSMASRGIELLDYCESNSRLVLLKKELSNIKPIQAVTDAPETGPDATQTMTPETPTREQTTPRLPLSRWFPILVACIITMVGTALITYWLVSEPRSELDPLQADVSTCRDVLDDLEEQLVKVKGAQAKPSSLESYTERTLSSCMQTLIKIDIKIKSSILNRS